MAEELKTPEILPANDPGSPAQKSGWKTTELVVAVAAILASVLPVVLDMLPPESKWIGLLTALLAATSYIAGRSFVKASGNKASAFVEAAKASAPGNPPKPPQ